MDKIKILVVEDSPLIAEDIAGKLVKHHFEVAGIFDRGEDALNFLNDKEADLVLLDIKLAGAMDGISTAYVINNTYEMPIVYLSDLADAETLQRAKQTRPSNYLTKPFNEADLVRALDLAFSNFSTRAPSIKDERKNHIFVKSDTTFIKISLDDIVFLHAERSYCNIVTENKTYVQSISMNHVYDQIHNKNFVRIHRSHVININKITAIEGNIVKLGKHQVEMSKSMREDLIGRLTFLKQ
jgi:DNA-binding LytR/AlgR family response regulator